MKKEKLQNALHKEEEKFSKKTYTELLKLDKNFSYECGSGKDRYQVEVNIVEKNEQFIQLLIAVDDGSLFRGIFPLSTSIVVNK